MLGDRFLRENFSNMLRLKLRVNKYMRSITLKVMLEVNHQNGDAIFRREDAAQE